ncbi:unnamed protein product [Lepeophtheirus salmonis]|uniref:(salmon louse) hypothetical protein n=2 Tax=Lepeophtheirus salmonis TaxID=72036 RepID=A0A7R8H916_LEPSM|nr:unnamed protein product [Lepeophtheirus salmonis]CAF2947718.1 unnamed protein product [Lepeophtheirus salmonis]
MLSNLASYIFGSGEQETGQSSLGVVAGGPSLGQHPGGSPVSSEEEGWVLVGTPPHDLNLGSIHEIPGSLLSSGEEEEEGDESNYSEGTPMEEGRLSSASRAGPSSTLTGSVLTRSKAMVAAQQAMQKKTKKALSAKMLERQNKAVKISASGSCKKQSLKHNFSIKSSGINKQLKQC